MKFGYVVLVAILLAACTDGALASSTSDVAGYIDAGDAAETCAIVDQGHVFASSDDVRARITGTWQQCGGAKIGISPLDTEGVALTAQEFCFLCPTTGGELVESADCFVNGALEIGNTDVERHVVFELGASTTAFRVRVSEDGLTLFLDDVARGVQSTFVRLR